MINPALYHIYIESSGKATHYTSKILHKTERREIARDKYHHTGLPLRSL